MELLYLILLILCVIAVIVYMFFKYYREDNQKVKLLENLLKVKDDIIDSQQIEIQNLVDEINAINKRYSKTKKRLDDALERLGDVKKKYIVDNEEKK